MSIDVLDLRSFYATPLGAVAQRFIGASISRRWSSCVGQSVLGVGYATPYLDTLRKDTVRTLAFMPAEQGVVNWPATGLSASALVDVTALPLPDSCMDRVLIVHALEMADQPYDFLSEVWRVLAPGGRMILVAPNRAGVWARVDSTPFGHGQPYSGSQLRSLLRDALFSPVYWGTRFTRRRSRGPTSCARRRCWKLLARNSRCRSQACTSSRRRSNCTGPR